MSDCTWTGSGKMFAGYYCGHCINHHDFWHLTPTPHYCGTKEVYDPKYQSKAQMLNLLEPLDKGVNYKLEPIQYSASNLEMIRAARAYVAALPD